MRTFLPGEHLACFLCVFQVSWKLALLLLLSRMSVAGPCTSEGCRRWTLVSTAVWPEALLEPPLATSVWRLEVRRHAGVPPRAYFLSQYVKKKRENSLCLHSGSIVLRGTGWRYSQRRGEYHPPLHGSRFPATDGDLAQTGRQTDSYEGRQPQ